MLENLLSARDATFLFGAALSFICGFLIGIERESRHKPAGISTNIFVCFGAMLFTSISMMIEPASQGRVAANIITGIGFLGAGIILHHKGFVVGLTTAASVWFTAAIGMAIGFQWYFAAVISAIFSVFVPRIPYFFENPELSNDEHSAKRRNRR